MNTRPSFDNGQDRQVLLDDACIPLGVRNAASARWQAGDTLWRCVKTKPAKGIFGFGAQTVVVEWWMLDQHGELIEVFYDA